MVTLKRIHLVAAIFAAIGIPVLTGIIGNVRAQSGLSEKILSSQLDAEAKYVHKEDFREVCKKLDAMSNQLNRIEGYIQRK